MVTHTAGPREFRQYTEPMTAPWLRNLFECQGEVPECRHARGKRYPLKTVLAVAVAARLAGYREATSFAQFATLLSQEQLEAVGAFWSPSKNVPARREEERGPKPPLPPSTPAELN